MKQNTASQRIVSELRDRIRTGAIAPGQPVPSARDIVREYGVAIATATKALARLREEGLVRAVPGVGTIVRGAPAARARGGAGPRARDEVDHPGDALTRARVVEAAIAVADDEGTAALTMRAVAKELGVATMSVYRHVASKEALLVMMADSVLGEEPVPPLTHTKRRWRAHLEALARMQWAGYRRHRWLAPMISMTRPQLLPSGMRITEAVLRAVTELGVTGADALVTGIAFLGLVRGFAVGLEAEREAEADSGMGQAEWMRSQEAAFAPQLAKLPTLQRLSSAIDIELTLDLQVERAVALFLDGLESG